MTIREHSSKKAKKKKNVGPIHQFCTIVGERNDERALPIVDADFQTLANSIALHAAFKGCCARKKRSYLNTKKKVTTQTSRILDEILSIC